MGQNPPSSSQPGTPAVPLDDVMIAMDVVDTLRHDKRIVERELDEETRRAELIERLRHIYREQGIEVPDHLLEEGVDALKQDRFKYDPPKDGLGVKLARIYVSRDKWGTWVLGGEEDGVFAMGQNPPSSSQPGTPAVPLDDVMIAMDVVDTLRHDKRIVERELDEETRRAELIERLRHIYREQGIEVPDHLLEEGVDALKQDRFKYDPPKDGLGVKLARIYVSRDKWGTWVLGGLAAVIITILGWYLTIERPRLRAIEARHIELTQTIPADIRTLRDDIRKISILPIAEDGEVAQLAGDALAAASASRLEEAREKRNRLRRYLAELAAAFKITIVQRRGELSGLWRVPKVNPRARNFYLVVEALDADGKPLTRRIFNEESSRYENVQKWAQRVPKSVLDRVQADKADDGIIQNAVIGEKKRGRSEITWHVKVLDGAITKWGR